MSDELKNLGVESATPEEITKEQIESFGKQVGIFLAAGLLAMETAGNVHKTLEVVKKSGWKETFEARVWLTLSKVLGSGKPGLIARAQFAYDMRTLENELRQQSFKIALEHHEKYNPEVVEALAELVDTADHCKRAAEALFSPVQHNLDSLIRDGQRLAEMQKMTQMAQVAQQDKEHDAKCDDPDCEAHTDH